MVKRSRPYPSSGRPAGNRAMVTALIAIGSIIMRTQEVLDADGPRHWFLDMPEAQVMSAARERELLLELAECRRNLLLATRRPDGSEWDLSRPDAEFRRAVRGLTDGHGPLNSTSPGDGTAPSDRPAALAAPHLARRYEEIRGALAMANSRLVAYIARRYLNRGISPSDLLQEGFCGLLEAIDRFDPVNTTRLATYAAWWIRQSIQRAIADGSYPVRLTPRQLRRLAQSLPRGPGLADGDVSTPPLTPRVGHPVHGGDPAANWQELAAIRPRVSLDAVSRFDESTPLAEILAVIPDDDHQTDDQAESVVALLAALNPREQLIVKLRFGLDGQPRHSLSQIGEVLAVSKERVRQIQDRALRKLRDAAAEPETEDQ
jgi:RNA polymerase primary sigma factor